MSYEDLMARIAREIPELAGKLSAPRVTYVKSLKKAYITFESSVLAGEREFLKLESILRDLFPGRPLAVRIISPGLKSAFLEDPSPYRQVLDDFPAPELSYGPRLDREDRLADGEKPADRNYGSSRRKPGRRFADACFPG